MKILESLPVLHESSPRLILSQIREHGPIDRASLARMTGLHPSTITRIVTSLISEGLVQEDGEGPKGLGRKPIMLSLVPEAIHVMGIAVESTFVSGILVNLQADILDRMEFRLRKQDMPSVEEGMALVIDFLLEKARERQVDVRGIGIAMHGIVDNQDGVCIFAPALGAREVPVAATVQARYNLPVCMDNNANALALGELWFGNGKGVDNLLAVKVGNSIGSGVIIDGRLYSGSRFWAGEVGHVTVVFDGPQCKCGNYGCLESVASIEAVVTKARLLLKRGEGSDLLALTGGDPDALTFSHLQEGAHFGNELTMQLWDEVGSHLGLALVNMINILNPTKILIGGDILPVIDYVLPKARQIVKIRSLEVLQGTTSIEKVGLGSDAVAVGAATLVFKELFEA